jgi:hypothetical protein
VASLKISKLKKKRGAAAAAHCSYYPVPALKCWAKERNDHYAEFKLLAQSARYQIDIIKK